MYYLCSNYKNKGVAGCSRGIAIRKEEVESKVLAAIKQRFTDKKIKIIVQEVNEILGEDNKDVEKAERYLQKSMDEKNNAIQNIMVAIQEGKKSNVILPLLLSQLEKLQEEKQSLEAELEEMKKETLQIQKVDAATILAKIQNLQHVMTASNTLNKEKKIAVRYFIGQLRFNPDEGEIYVYFWHDPTSNRTRYEKDKTLKK